MSGEHMPSEIVRRIVEAQKQQAIGRDAYSALSPRRKVEYKRARTHSSTSLLGASGPDDFRAAYLAGRIDVFEFEDRLDAYYGLSRLT